MRARLAQGQGGGPRRRGAESGAGALSIRGRDRHSTLWPKARAAHPSQARRRSAPPTEGRAEPAAGGALARAARWRSGARCRRRARRGPTARCCARRATCRGGAISARPRGGSRCCTRSPISSSTRSISPGTSSRGSAMPACRAHFFDDWLGVAAEEAEHFALLSARLDALGSAYGDLPAHDGLWEAAAATAHDLIARLAVVPLVLEARGLDVTPEMIQRLERAGDPASAAILARIYARRDRPCRGRGALVRPPVPRARPRPESRLPRPRPALFHAARSSRPSTARRATGGLPRRLLREAGRRRPGGGMGYLWLEQPLLRNKLSSRRKPGPTNPRPSSSVSGSRLSPGRLFSRLVASVLVAAISSIARPRRDRRAAGVAAARAGRAAASGDGARAADRAHRRGDGTRHRHGEVERTRQDRRHRRASRRRERSSRGRPRALPPRRRRDRWNARTKSGRWARSPSGPMCW